MNVLDIIVDEHRAVLKALDETLESVVEVTPPLRDQVYGNLSLELLLHNEVEQDLLYWQLQEEGAEAPAVSMGNAQHDMLARLIDQIDDENLDADDWLARLREVRDGLDDHVRHEEQAIHPLVRQRFSAGELENLGQQFVSLKARLRERLLQGGERGEARERAMHEAVADAMPGTPDL